MWLPGMWFPAMRFPAHGRLLLLIVGLLLAPTVFALGIQGTESSDSTGTDGSAESVAEEGRISNPPVTLVALYTNGVGYFEHETFVDGDASIMLTVPTEQVSDMLKSLVVQDLGGGTVESVTYASREPLARALADLSVDLSRNTSWQDLMAQLRGAEVQVTADRRVDGRIVGVETKPGTQEVPQSAYLTLMTADGLTRVDLASVRTLSFRDPALESDVRQALSLLDSGRNQETTTVSVNLSGEARRRVRVGYTREAPIWKTSYRLVLQDGDRAVLQGWGIVENPSRQGWESAQVSLLSGSPVAFSMALSEPIYLRRPTVEVPRAVAAAPQEYEKSIAPAPSRSRPSAGRAAPAPEAAFELSAADEFMREEPRDFAGSVEAGATGGQVGALFRYDVAEPVTLAPQSAAMLPIVVADVPIREVTLYDASVNAVYPYRGVEMENTSAVHLSSGPVTVVQAGTFLGDALIPAIDPGSKQLLSYAVDLETEVSREMRRQPERITALKAVDGVLTIRRTLRRETHYRIAFRGSEDRTLLIEHPRSAEWRLLDPPSAVEETRSSYRIAHRLEAPEGEASQTQVVLAEERPLTESVHLLPASISTIGVYLEGATLSPALRRALTRLSELKRELESLESKRRQIDNEVDAIYRSQQRIRENMARLDRDSTLYRRYVDTMSEQEDRLETLSIQRQSVVAEIEAQRQRIADFVGELNIE